MANSSVSDTEVRALFASLASSWERGDADAYARLFSKDAHYVAFDGVDQHGREAIARMHRFLFRGPLRGSRLLSEIAALDLLGADVALVHAYGYILEKGRKAPQPSRLSTQTLVAQRRREGWQFISFHNTRVRPVARGLRSFVAWKLADALWSATAPAPRSEDTGMLTPLQPAAE